MAEGRRVPKSLAVATPSCQLIALACAPLGVPVAVEMGKRHPREPFTMGRVRVQLKDDEGRLIKEEIPNNRILLRLIAKRLPEAKSRLPNPIKDVVGTSSMASTKTPTEVTSPGGDMVLVPRKKKSAKKK